MKKLILSLFAVAAIFVACDKDYEDDFEIMPEVSVEDAIEMEDQIDSAFEFLGSIEVPKGEASSSKVGASGTQWLHIIFFDAGGQNLALMSSDDSSEICWSNIPGFAFSSLYTWDASTRGLTVVVENSEGEMTPVTRTQSAAGAERFNRLFGQTVQRLRVTNPQRRGAISGTPPALTTINFTCVSNVITYSSTVSVGEQSASASAGRGMRTVTLPGIPASVTVTATVSGASRAGTTSVTLTEVSGTTSKTYTLEGIPAAEYSLSFEIAGSDTITGNTNIEGWVQINDESGVKTFGHTNGAEYETFDAPGPLSGTLSKATLGAGGSTNVGNVLNYAADSEADVKTAIEGSFGFVTVNN